MTGLPEPVVVPLPNRADDSWGRLNALREQAIELGIDVDDAWPIARVEQEIAAKRA